MKGRIYDPTIGRFLQADPFIQAPKNSQNYNRYSYVLNNPMSYTDPSGYFFKAVFNFIKKNWRTIVSIVASYVTFGLTTAAWGFAEIANLGAGMLIGGGAASGFVGGLVSTGSLRGAFQGALSGALFGAIGGAGLEGWSAFSVSGIAGGMLSELQGGQFGHGFISAGIGAVSGGLFGKAPINRVVGSAIIGGTISELTGGKFANGAMTAAFAAALRADWSDIVAPNENSSPNDGMVTENNPAATAKTLIARAYENGTLTAQNNFTSADKAAAHVLGVIHGISETIRLELGGYIIKTDSGYSYGDILVGESRSIIALTDSSLRPDGAVAAFHTHPRGTNYFSFGDATWVSGPANMPLYLSGNQGVRVCEVYSCGILGPILYQRYNSHYISEGVVIPALQGRLIRGW